MDQNGKKQLASTTKHHKEEHEKILAALRKEFDYDTGVSGKYSYQRICNQLQIMDTPPKSGPRWYATPQLRDWLLAQKYLYENTPELMDHPSSFAEQVRIGVANIVKHKLNKNVKDLPQKILMTMRSWGHDSQWIKDKLNLKSSQIHALLNTKKPKTTISAFYLEAFCLIFFADPYDFLNLRNAKISIDSPLFFIPPFNPLTPLDDTKLAFYNFIMSRFADPNDNDKLLRLRIITKIARLKTDKYQIFQNIVSQVPSLSNALSSPLPSIAAHSLDDNLKEYIRQATTEYMLCDISDKTQPYYVIAEAGQFLRYLTRFDLDRMETLARFTNADDTVWSILIAILIDGGFPPKSISLHDKFDNFIA